MSVILSGNVVAMQLTNAIICICMHPSTLPPSQWLTPKFALYQLVISYQPAVQLSHPLATL